MISNYKQYTERHLQGLAKSLNWVNPNALTLIGIIPQLLFFIFMRSHHFGWALVALACSAIDMLDGLVARANNKTSAYGAFLDSTIDRVSDFIIIAAFYAAGLISLNLSAILLLCSFLISYMRAAANLPAGGLIQRSERIIFLFLVVILQAIFPGAQMFGHPMAQALIFILTILSIYTVLQRVWYAYKKLN